MHFDVRGWSPKIDIDIFEEPINSPKFLSCLFCPKSIFQNKGCLSLIGVVLSKMIFGCLKSPKLARNCGVVYFAQNVFLKIKDCLSVMGLVFSKMIFEYFKSPKIAPNY